MDAHPATTQEKKSRWKKNTTNEVRFCKIIVKILEARKKKM